MSGEREAELGELVEETRRHLLWLRDAGFHDLPAPGAARSVTARRSVPASASAAAPAPAGEAPARGPGPAGEALPYGPGDKGCGSGALLSIRRDLGECTRCKLSAGRTHLVFGVGNPEAELMFVGEGPGADEDPQGNPSWAGPGSCSRR